MISADRIVLRRHSLNDYFRFMRFMGDPDTIRYLNYGKAGKTSKQVEELLNSIIDSYDSDTPIFSLTIADSDTDGFLGSCSLTQYRDGVEMYYALLRDMPDPGVASETVRALSKYAYNELNVKKIVMRIASGDTPGIRFAKWLGFTEEGEHSGEVMRLVLTSFRKVL